MNKSWWWIASYIIIGILLGAGVLFLVTRPPRGKLIELLPPPTQAPLLVYVSGAVSSPGLFNLSPGSRIDDAIQAAGGITSDADTNMLNLAQLLHDGDHILVPVQSSIASNSSEGSKSGVALTVIDINTATLELLETLPGIGPKIAQQVIDYRTTNGPFSKIEDMLDVPDIGQVTFDKIKDLISVGTIPP